jgi:dTMP kinase
MSEEDTQAIADSEVRGAELRENLAMTDARRAEEEVARAHAEAEAAAKAEEKLSRKEKRLREKAERVHAEAERMRAAADAEAAAAVAAAPPVYELPASEPPSGPAQRPEVLIGGAFVGAFLAARILKRIFD